MTKGTTRRKAIGFMLAMGAAAVLAQTARPRRVDDPRTRVPLEQVFPATCGDWQMDGLAQAFVQPPDEQGRIYGFYDQVLQRAYRRRGGDQVMLSIAYGAEQSPALQVHRPEICYSAGGFDVRELHRVDLPLNGRSLPATRLHAWKLGRSEPVTYWTVLGDVVVADGRSFRWHQLMMAMRGELRDGMLVRISSLGQDPGAGYALHAAFAGDLMQAIALKHRDRVFGQTAA